MHPQLQNAGKQTTLLDDDSDDASEGLFPSMMPLAWLKVAFR